MMMGSSPMGGPPGAWPRQVQNGSLFADNAPPSNPLHISWQDGHCPAAFIKASNVLDYFSNPYNPFYDRTCNNETLKMQRLPIDQLTKFIGIEYTVLYALEPLFVIRKQKRHTPTQVTPIADYYIISGTVYQAPDLCSVVNSRLSTAMNHVRSAFEEAQSCMRYNPSKGYWWEFKGQTSKQDEKKEPVEVRFTAFQKNRVDTLLADLAQKFPPPSETQELKSQLPTVAPATANGEKMEPIAMQQGRSTKDKTMIAEPLSKKPKIEPI